jgi:uncharacterized protein (TIGR02145 family)
MKKIIQLPLYIFISLLIVNCSNDDADTITLGPETVMDADGNTYSSVKIGNQIWMAENLKTTKYNNGNPITEYTFAEFGNDWMNLSNQDPFYQWADTNDLNNDYDEELPVDYYGGMYNHFAIETGQLAPEGWRIPTVEDFEELESYLTSQGHTGNEATVLKSVSGWSSLSGNGTNLYNFNGLPNGYVNALGGPTLAGGISTWATTEVSSGSIASQTRVNVSLFDDGAIRYDTSGIQIGAAIRCIKIQ